MNYKIVEKGDALFDEENDIKYLFCTPFENIKVKDSLSNVPEVKNVTVNSFLNYSITSIEHRLNVTNLLKINESYIFNDHVCFLTTKSELETDGNPFSKFLEIYAFFNIFIYSKEKTPYLYENAYRRNDSIGSINFKIYKKKIFNRNHLLNSDCLNRENQINYNRGNCLNKCLKPFKTKTSFYDFKDNEFLDLNKIVKSGESVKQNVNDQFLNTGKNFQYCLKKCKPVDCFWEVVTTVKTPFSYLEHLREEGEENVTLLQDTYSAYYSTDDYYLQLFGLLTLFTGTSIVTLLPALLLLSVKKFKRHHFLYYKFLKIFRLVYPKVKFTITLISFAFVLNQCISMINEYNTKTFHPIKTSTTTFISEPLSLVVCFPIEIAFSQDEEERIEEGRNSAILKKYDLNSIEEHITDFFLNPNKSFNLEIVSGSGPIKMKYNISKEIIFKNSTFENQTCLSRCFRFDFEMEDLRYKMMIPPVILDFTSKVRYKEYFLVGKNQNFTSGLVKFKGMFNNQRIVKKLSESSKSICRDYSKEQSCDSRRNCLDRCLTIEFTKKHGSIPMNAVLNTSHLPSFVLNSEFKFNENIDLLIEEQCLNLFRDPDCTEIYFEESHELILSKAPRFSFQRLTYLNKIEREAQYEIAKTFLDILSQWSIFFGINARGALATLFFTICKTFRLKFHKVYKVIIFLMAGTGFLIHLSLVFQGIIRSELKENEFFAKPESYSMPAPIFCFHFRKDIDNNQRLTGDYLDHLTKNYTFEQVFDKIEFYNGSRYETLLNELDSTKNSSFYSRPYLRLTHFYYYNYQKCFKINLDLKYQEEDFYFLEDKEILKVYLKREFTVNHTMVFFGYQQSDSNEMNGLLLYNIGKYNENSTLYYHSKIEFELFKIVSEDKFELLKDPRNLFYGISKVNDVTDYFNTMRKQFHDDYNLTTSDFLLDKYFNVQIDNELFEQYFRQIQDPLDQTKFKSLDFEQNIPNMFTSIFLENYDHAPDFIFSLSHLARLVVITNNENYTKIVVTVLNSLSLWLNICILDLGTYINQILRLGLHVYYLLIWVRCRIRRAIDNLGSI